MNICIASTYSQQDKYGQQLSDHHRPSPTLSPCSVLWFCILWFSWRQVLIEQHTDQEGREEATRLSHQNHSCSSPYPSSPSYFISLWANLDHQLSSRQITGMEEQSWHNRFRIIMIHLR